MPNLVRIKGPLFFMDPGDVDNLTFMSPQKLVSVVANLYNLRIFHFNFNGYF